MWSCAPFPLSHSPLQKNYQPKKKYCAIRRIAAPYIKAIRLTRERQVSSMRKAGIFVISAVLAISLMGCSQEDVDTESGEASLPSSFSAGESSKTSGTDEKETVATAEPETTTNPAVSERPEAAAASSEKQQGDNQSGGSQTGSGSTSKPPAASQPSSPAPPKQSEPAKPDTPAAPTPEPTEPAKPKSAYDAPYDTAAIIADTKAYGESIGMTWSGSLNTGNCSWEAPGSTSPTLSGERLKEAVRSSIRRIKKLQSDNGYQPGEFHFKVQFESAGSGEYTIYFLMG
jgi:hypothetical protein